MKSKVVIVGMTSYWSKPKVVGVIRGRYFKCRLCEIMEEGDDKEEVKDIAEEHLALCHGVEVVKTYKIIG